MVEAVTVGDETLSNFATWLRIVGAPLSVILKAGEWKSAAFLTYLDGCELERDAVLEAALLSDDEAWID